MVQTKGLVEVVGGILEIQILRQQVQQVPQDKVMLVVALLLPLIMRLVVAVVLGALVLLQTGLLGGMVVLGCRQLYQVQLSFTQVVVVVVFAVAQ